MDQLATILNRGEDRVTDYIETSSSAWSMSEATARDLCREIVGPGKTWTFCKPPPTNPLASGTLVQKAGKYMDQQARSRRFSDSERQEIREAIARAQGAFTPILLDVMSIIEETTPAELGNAAWWKRWRASSINELAREGSDELASSAGVYVGSDSAPSRSRCWQCDEPLYPPVVSWTPGTLVERVSRCMDKQARSRYFSETERQGIRDAIQRAEAAFTSTLSAALKALEANPEGLADAAWWRALADESINQLAQRGERELDSMGGVYLGVGFKADRVHMIYVGRGKTFVGRVVSGHLANLAVPGKSVIHLHYTLAGQCNEVLYFPAVCWKPVTDTTAMNTAEWLVCALLGTFQLSEPLNQ
ncbi:unnamed protein product [Parajaminaea phylloscopi]